MNFPCYAENVLRKRSNYLAKVLLSDIAKECGVSVSTVSRVLSGDRSRKISTDTVSAVIDSARRMGYFASRMKTLNQNKVIKAGILFLSDHESILSPFFSEIVEGIRQECERTSVCSIQLKVLSIYEDDFFKNLESERFDIAILLGRVRKEVLKRVRACSRQLIYTGLNPVGGMDEVICDARQGIAQSVSFLHSIGHRKIAFLGPVNQDRVHNEFRYEGYLEGLRACGLDFDPSLVCDSYLTSEDGYSRSALLFSSASPTALICANDNLAAGAMKWLSDNSHRIPDDVSVTGFDNISASAYLSPSLTTIDVPKREMGRFALLLALERSESARNYPVRLNLPFTLIKRDSVKELAHA